MKGSREMTAGLQDLLAYSLRHGAADSVPLGEEVHFVRQYLRLQSLRFGERLRASVADMVQASVQGLSDHTARHVAGFLIAVYDGLQVQWLIDPQRAPTPDQLMAALETVLPAALATAPVGGSSRTTNPPAACS